MKTRMRALLRRLVKNLRRAERNLFRGRRLLREQLGLGVSAASAQADKSPAAEIVRENLRERVEPLLSKYLGIIQDARLRPGQFCDIYPWYSPKDVVMAAADELRKLGWQVRCMPYSGSRANYPAGDYFLRVSAPIEGASDCGT